MQDHLSESRYVVCRGVPGLPDVVVWDRDTNRAFFDLSPDHLRVLEEFNGRCHSPVSFPSWARVDRGLRTTESERQRPQQAG